MRRRTARQFGQPGPPLCFVCPVSTQLTNCRTQSAECCCCWMVQPRRCFTPGERERRHSLSLFSLNKLANNSQPPRKCRGKNGRTEAKKSKRETKQKKTNTPQNATIKTSLAPEGEKCRLRYFGKSISCRADVFGRANCQKGGTRKVNMLYYTVESLYLLHSRCVRPTVLSASLPIFSLLCRLADAVGVERCQETSNIWWQSNRQEEEEQVHSQQKKKEKKNRQRALKYPNDLACARWAAETFSCLRSSLQKNCGRRFPLFYFLKYFIPRRFL